MKPFDVVVAVRPDLWFRNLDVDAALASLRLSCGERKTLRPALAVVWAQPHPPVQEVPPLPLTASYGTVAEWLCLLPSATACLAGSSQDHYADRF